MRLQDFVEPRLRDVLTELGVDQHHPVIFETPRQEGQGHLSTTVAMGLAKALRQPPKAIADKIVERLGSLTHVTSIDVAGPGFINVTFAPSAFSELLGALAQEGDAIGRSTIGVGKTVNVEYVSANPTGPLHAGHGRNCAVGDTIANLFDWCGYSVTREYYFNNAGNQMNKLAESIQVRTLNALGDNIDFPEDGYHGDYIHTIAEEVANEYGTAFRDRVLDEQLSICRKAGELWCFASIRTTLQRLGIQHDVYFNEDSLYSNGSVASTIEALRNEGLVYDKDGAVWFELTKLGLEKDKVIVKSTGEPTYRLPDIAYHRDKLGRGYDIVVDIFGADHIATIPDVLAGVRALGFDTERVKVVIHQMVTFIDNNEVVKFSKRTGKSFTLDDLIDEVGADVVRFFFVMRAVGTHLEFDLGLAKKEGDVNPVFYLQYAHARICSVLKKAEEAGFTVSESADLQLLTHERELELIAMLSRLRFTLERAAENVEPHTIADFLRDLAGAYHNWYHDCRILGNEQSPVSAELTSARLLLADVTRRALRNGLQMLGLSQPERM